jgi:molecular chaperone HtpG
MYGEPRHTLREYIQNSFDSIRAAERMKLLSDRGRIDITVAADRIIIYDNGLGVPSEQAWATLTSIGASKKDRQRDAGFRGIGRLAGMAYCDELKFRTTFLGETRLTIVSFDCRKLLAGMDPDEGGEVELAKLLEDSITFELQEEGAAEEEHFFEVTLSGLDRTPRIPTDAAEIREYLAENSPVEFAPDFEHRELIAAEYRSYFGESIETIDIYLNADGETRQIYKHYEQTYKLANGTAQLQKVDIHQGDDDLYWGWVGHLNESGAVTDWRTRGLRIRLRNIQVDRTEIFERLFTEVKPSFGRFSAYYVGEIHINPEKVIPNARRDGFEETRVWLTIQEKLRGAICVPLAKDAYEASKSRQSDVEKVVDDINKLVEQSQTLALSSRATYDQVVDLMNSAKRLRRRAASRLKLMGDLEDTVVDLSEPKRLTAAELQEAARSVEEVEAQARLLIGQFLSEDQRIDALKQRLRQEIVNELLDIVNPFVDPATYQRIRRRLLKTGGPNQ